MGKSKELSHNETGILELFEPYCGLYPGISSFTREYDATDYREWVSRSNGDPVPAPLMLVVQDSTQAGATGAAHRLDWHTVIMREIHLQGALFDRDRPLEGIVCAPAIAAGWSNDALYDLSSNIQKAFSLAPAAFTRWCACFGKTRPPVARLKLLRVLGFSKIRLGVDLSQLRRSEAEQLSEFERAEHLLVEARNLGYRALAVDLMLPAVVSDALVSRIETFLAQTRAECLRLMVAEPHQGSATDTPLSLLRPEILAGLGYRHLGMDWYVTAADPSLGSGAPLHWSPLGYTNIKGLDIIGVGPGAVSVLEDASSQNALQRAQYQRLVNQGEIPTECGVELESDDVLRRSVMTALLVNERFDIEVLEERWGIIFSRYFETEIPRLRELEQQGKLMLGEREIRTLDRGRDALLALCKVFDNQDRVARVSPLEEVH